MTRQTKRTPYKPHPYQKIAEAHALETPYAGMILDMGLGKTVITWTVLQKLLGACVINKPLIIAPKLVTEQTWLAELNKWQHLEGLKLSRIIGGPQERIDAIYEDADVYAVSRDNIKWLVDYLGTKWCFDMLVLDELSSFKSHKSKRFKAIQKIRGRVDRVIGLTGTPAPNGLLDLWSQVFILDQGKRLEKNIEGYRNRYFKKVNIDQYQVKYELRPGAEQSIYGKLQDICISMSAKDWLDIKPREDRVQRIKLPDITAYRKFQKEKILELVSADKTGIYISPANAAGLYNKLLQFCNGAVYDDDLDYHIVNQTKLDVLEEEIEALMGKPVLVFYQFQSDLTRIQERIPSAVRLRGTKQIDAWNRGEIPVLIAHAQGASHGLNLQEGGHNMIWYGLPWSLEFYLQAVARLDRQGQPKVVLNKILITEGTVEELVWRRLGEKGLTQDDLIFALRTIVNEDIEA